MLSRQNALPTPSTVHHHPYRGAQGLFAHPVFALTKISQLIPMFVKNNKNNNEHLARIYAFLFSGNSNVCR
jgi:hypothetical protein